MKRLLCIFIAMLFIMTTLCARQYEKAESVPVQKDTINVVKVGYGHSEKRAKAKALALEAANDSLLLVLRDSVAPICKEVKVCRDEKGEYLQIKFFTNKEQPSKFYFHEEGILNNITVVHKECVRGEDKRYKAECVLSAPREEFSRASNIVMFHILEIMSSF